MTSICKSAYGSKVSLALSGSSITRRRKGSLNGSLAMELRSAMASNKGSHADVPRQPEFRFFTSCACHVLLVDHTAAERLLEWVFGDGNVFG
eukprot:CAMPEP_0177309344 /NCGR_PEP_ID=MMETSP0368-20130122/9238_1 /TAXON_ID=447022 ORGANISM="Scrippsiella hangoei-like, Strain SHHI-4" /NCGR_SAMPLE_ID=MMETSP0368 /ASSEMBLY_ACC=CAM_ASM_000363 /LENGTH=91 /DNA_ID=CAMNT_0018768195 /DNA_START=635 /DNA_END=906 /DNA_ORIENTATION=-